MIYLLHNRYTPNLAGLKAPNSRAMVTAREGFSTQYQPSSPPQNLDPSLEL